MHCSCTVKTVSDAYPATGLIQIFKSVQLSIIHIKNTQVYVEQQT